MGGQLDGLGADQHVPAVADEVQPEDGRVVVAGEDGVGEALAQDLQRGLAEGVRVVGDVAVAARSEASPPSW